MRHVIRVLTAAILLIGVGQGQAHADVTEVEGGAFGYYLNVTLFGGPQPPVGPTPTVTLPADGSAGPITATAPTGRAVVGPATFFTSGQLNVSTQGTTGATGSVTSSTNIQTVNTSGQEVFTANSVASSCTATEADISSGSTTVTNGTLQTDSGDDDLTNTIPDHSPVTVTLPANPPPNTSYDGHIHPGNSTDNFRYVFNEQIRNPDGSITINAAHQYLLGPTAVGDLIVGQSVCRVTAAPDTTGPKVLRTAPTANATRIARGANVNAYFSEAMRVDSINTTTVNLFKKGTTTPIAAVVSYDASTKKAVLNPNANLKRGAKYKAVVTIEAKDLAGNGLDQDPTLSGNQPKQWFFTVRN